MFVINQDSFYRNLNEKELQNAAKFHFNFDHPNAINLDKVSIPPIFHVSLPSSGTCPLYP